MTVTGRLWQVLRPYRGWMALGVLLALLGVLAGIGLLAVAGGFIASMAIAGLAGATLNYFTPAALIRAFAIVRTGGRYLERLFTHEATLRALSGLRLWLFDRLLPLAPGRTGFLGHADLFARLRADVDRLEHAFLAIAVPVMVALLALPVVIVVQAAYALPVALMTLLAVLVVAGLLPWWLTARGGRAAREVMEADTALRAASADLVRGAEELTLYGVMPERVARVGALGEAQRRAQRRLDGLQGLGSALVPTVAQLIAVGSLLLAARAHGAHALGAPDVAMLVLLALAVFETLSTLPEAFAQLGATRAAAARVFELAERKPVVAEPVVPAPAPQGSDIRFRGVSLCYPGTDRPALDGVDLHLRAGTRLAVLGASGAGKSSLLQVLLGFQAPTGGVVELDGRPLTDYAGDDIRACMAVVEQRTHIFNASLLENLLVARPDATSEQLAAALDGAQLTETVARWPDGLDTWLGESGVNLSGGEARRVAIARALLADRPVLLLDEPTEGLDAATAQSLLAALAVLTRGRTVLLITHRLGGLSGLVERQLTMADGRLNAAIDHTDGRGLNNQLDLI